MSDNIPVPVAPDDPPGHFYITMPPAHDQGIPLWKAWAFIWVVLDFGTAVWLLWERFVVR